MTLPSGAGSCQLGPADGRRSAGRWLLESLTRLGRTGSGRPRVTSFGHDDLPRRERRDRPSPRRFLARSPRAGVSIGRHLRGSEARLGGEERAECCVALPVATMAGASGRGHVLGRAGATGSNPGGQPGRHRGRARLGWRADQPSWLPRLPTTVILGDSTMGAYLEERIERLLPEAGGGPEPVDPERSSFGAQVPLGNLRPLLWRDWFSHLQADEHDHLAAELDEDLAATAGPLVGRARQIAWYLSAELLVDEDDPKLAANHARCRRRGRFAGLPKVPRRPAGRIDRLSGRVDGGGGRPGSRGSLAGAFAARGCRVLARRRGELVLRMARPGLAERSAHKLASRRHASERHERRGPGLVHHRERRPRRLAICGPGSSRATGVVRRSPSELALIPRLLRIIDRSRAVEGCRTAQGRILTGPW